MKDGDTRTGSLPPPRRIFCPAVLAVGLAERGGCPRPPFCMERKPPGGREVPNTLTALRMLKIPFHGFRRPKQTAVRITGSFLGCVVN